VIRSSCKHCVDSLLMTVLSVVQSLCRSVYLYNDVGLCYNKPMYVGLCILCEQASLNFAPC